MVSRDDLRQLRETVQQAQVSVRTGRAIAAEELLESATVQIDKMLTTPYAKALPRRGVVRVKG